MKTQKINLVLVYMAKRQKTKIKKTEKVKAVAKTRKGGAQAQVQNVVVKIGETKKRARRRRAPPKKKSEGTGKPITFPPSGDGWMPPQNLMRNGATFAGAEQIRYVNVPTPAQTSFIAGGAVQPPTFVPPAEPVMPEEPDIQSGYDATFAPESDSGINMTEFLKEWKQPRERQSYILSEEEEKSFAPPIPESPTFAEPVEEQPTLVEAKSKRPPPPIPSPTDDTQTPKTPMKELSNRVILINQITGMINELEKDGLIPKRGKGKTEFINKVFGQFGEYKGAVKNYNEGQLRIIKANIEDYEFEIFPKKK